MKFKKSNVFQLTLVLGVVATLMILLPALSFEGETYAGYSIAFGKSLADFSFPGFGTFASASLNFNIIVIIMFLLPVSAGVISLLKPELSLLSAILFIVSGILMVIIKDFVDVHYTIAGTSGVIEVEWDLAIGLILGIILNGIGAATALLISFD